MFEFLEERSEGRCVRNCDLREKALEVAASLNLPNFKASPQWMAGWKRRWNVGRRRGTNTSQRVPADYKEQLLHFRRSCLRFRVSSGMDSSSVWNMDQTMCRYCHVYTDCFDLFTRTFMCRFDPLPGATNNIRGARTVRIAASGVQKKGFIVALCASAAGEKLPAYIIFKERGGKLGPRVTAALTFPDNVKVSASTNGWMTREELHRWLRGVWKESSIRRLLVLDNYHPHLGEDTASLAESMDTDLCYDPGGCTGIAQPMDVSINAPFKKAFQEQWIQWRRTPAARRPDGKLMIPTRQHVIDWVSKAWEMIIKSFLVCGISNAVDGFEDNLIREEIPRDLDDSDDEADENTNDDDGDVDDLDPFSDSDE